MPRSIKKGARRIHSRAGRLKVVEISGAAIGRGAGGDALC